MKILESIMKRLNPQGEEVFHKPPKTVTLTRPPLTLEQKVAQLLRSQQLAKAAKSEGYETFEESEDFDVGEDINDPFTNQPFEYEEVQEQRVKSGLRAADEEIKTKRSKPSPAASAAKAAQVTPGATAPAASGKTDESVSS